MSTVPSRHRIARCWSALLASGLFLALAPACGFIDGLQGATDHQSANSKLSQLAWHGPESIDRGLPVNSSAPVLAWGQGAAWLTFQAVDYAAVPVTSSAWITRRPRGGSFASPVQVPAVNGWNGGAFYPRIAIGKSGDAVFATNEVVENSTSNITGQSVWGTRLATDLTQSGGPLVRIDQNNAVEDNTLVSLVADEAGTAMVLYSLSGNGSGAFARTQAPGASWSNPVELDTTPLASIGVVAGSAGSAIFTSVDYGTSTYATQAAPLSFSGTSATLGPPLSFPDAGSGQFLIAALRGDEGMVVAAREHSDTLVTDGYSGGFWRGMQNIVDPNVSAYIEPSVAVNSKGEALLLWQDFALANGDGYGGTLQASFWDGGSWSPQQQISAPNANPHAWWAAADLNEQGEAVAAWADFDSTGTYTRIYADVLETSSGAPVWSGAVPIDSPSPDAGLATDPANVRYVNVALEPDGGSAQVVWIGYQTSDTTVPRVWSNYLEAN